MKSRSELRTLIQAAIGLAVLILDGNTAAEGAKAGLNVCLQTVLPSLFPFIFLSSMLSSSLLSGHLGSSSLLCRLYRIPRGSEGILLTGLLGGYPVGAKCIGEAVSNGQLSRTDAKRMLVFCNAAGPAFLFGITGSIFPQRWIPWCLWGIHLFSGLCMARLLPSSPGATDSRTQGTNLSIPQRLRQSIQVMGEICGWIIIMRIVISFARKWLLWYLPEQWQIFVTGILEISNGCVSLYELTNNGLRFLFCSVFLGFGGLCVALQTDSAAPLVNKRIYLPGKLFQGLISFIMAYTVQYFAFSDEENVQLLWPFFAALVLFFGIFVYFKAKEKKSCGIFESIGV